MIVWACFMPRVHAEAWLGVWMNTLAGLMGVWSGIVPPLHSCTTAPGAGLPMQPVHTLPDATPAALNSAPQEDAAATGTRDADQFGRERLSNVADTWAGAGKQGGAAAAAAYCLRPHVCHAAWAAISARTCTAACAALQRPVFRV